MKCPICGVNIPRFALSVIAAFILIFLTDWVWHGMVMADLYAETPQLWRGEMEMSDYFIFMLVTQLVLAKWLALVYTRNHEGKGLMEGLRYGFWMGGLAAVLAIQSYAYLPVPVMVPVLWAVGYMIQFMLVGVVIAKLYKPCCDEAPCCKAEADKTESEIG